MRKILAIFLVLVLLIVSVGATGCQPFCEHEYSQADYLRASTCQKCGKINPKQSKPLQGESTYDLSFKFTQEQKTQLQTLLAELKTTLETLSEQNESDLETTYLQFEQTYVEFCELLDIAIDEYKLAYLCYCQDQTPNQKGERDFEFASELYNEFIGEYYALFQTIYDSPLRDMFFCEQDGWTESDVELALYYASCYGTEFTTLSAENDRILTEFRALGMGWYDTDQTTVVQNGQTLNLYDKVRELFLQMVGNNQQQATLCGFDNFFEYSLFVRGRDYSVEQLCQMREFVKEYVAPLLCEMSYSNNLSLNLYFMQTFSSRWDLIVDFVEFMSQGQQVSMYDALNALMQNKNFVATNSSKARSGAFTNYLTTQNLSFMFFGRGYDSPLSFIHEFGHYFDNVVNGSFSPSLDIAEAQSQGNEMMFLQFALQNGDSHVTQNVVAYELKSMLCTLVQSTIIDEFEYYVYTNQTKYGSVEKTNLEYIYQQICLEYAPLNELERAFGYRPDVYWKRVCIESPCYYVSYAISLIPSLQIFVQAGQNIEQARQTYLSIVDYSQAFEYVHENDVGFLDVLQSANLSSPFEQETYQTIFDWFNQTFLLEVN